MSREAHEEDDERSRQKKLEEALEVKSLRRIVSAYLNYPDAADADVKRYERSFKKLPPAHKALLSHYPSKFKKLRRCISANTHFIFGMLQAFEPPLDMSLDTDNCEDHHTEDAKNEHGCSEAHNVCSCHSTSVSGTGCFSESNKGCCDEESNLRESPKGDDAIKISCNKHSHCEEAVNEGHCESITGCKNLDSEDRNDMETSGGNGDMDSKGNVSSPSHEWLDSSIQLNVPLADVDKVRCIIRNIVRDWAAEGQKERDQCYNPILEELDAQFPNRKEANPPTCLVPGAGLGRLALEISRLGFVSQGNEFSYYMMIGSNFILNHTQDAVEWEIYPWIHTNCNLRSDSDQLRSVLIPDIHPAREVFLFKLEKVFITIGDGFTTYVAKYYSAGITEGFSMCGGDFVEVYSDPSQIGAWDAVVTCFFIDTAHNIVEYIEIISKILKDGGVWINLGPLLYHFAEVGQEDEMSIELSLEDVKRVALHYGFRFEKQNTIETTYATNFRSMMQNRYFTEFWTAIKISAAEKEHHP